MAAYELFTYFLVVNLVVFMAMTNAQNACVKDIKVAFGTDAKTSFRVSWVWGAPSTDCESPADDIIIQHSLLVRDQCEQIENPQRIIAFEGDGSRGYTMITGLEPFSKYEVTVSLTLGTNDQLYIFTKNTSEAEPGVPQNIRIRQRTATTLGFSWDEIPCGERKAGIENYRVLLENVATKTHHTTSTNHGVFNHLFSGLSPNTAYKFAVQSQAFLEDDLILSGMYSRLFPIATLAEGVLYVALERVAHGDLLRYLRDSRLPVEDNFSEASSLTSTQLMGFALDVARGMRYLADHEIIHRDLAARNVLVGDGHDGLIAKVSDFGMSRGDSVYYQRTNRKIPVKWTAIEALTKKIYTTKSDVWSFGILLWEIVSLGGTPYMEPMIENRDLTYYLQSGYRMDKPSNCDDKTYDIMMKCWDGKPDKRPTFRDLVTALKQLLENESVYVITSIGGCDNFAFAAIDPDSY